MTQVASEQFVVVRRPDRGLSIAGTRITLYDIMERLSGGWSPAEIRDWFKLTDSQIAAVMAYIEAHRAEVQAEYEQVLQDAEENRRYWEERNRERLAEVAAMPHPPEQAAIRAKLAEHRASRDRS